MHVVFSIDIILRLTMHRRTPTITLGWHERVAVLMGSRRWSKTWVQKKLKTNQSGLLQLSSIANWALILFKIKNENAFKLQMYKYDEVSP